MTALFLFAFLSSLEKLDIFSYVLAFAILTEINYSYPVFTFVIESDSKFIANAFSCLLPSGFQSRLANRRQYHEKGGQNSRGVRAFSFLVPTLAPTLGPFT